MNCSTRERDSWQKGWRSNMAPVPACRRSRPSQALPSLRCKRFERQKLFLGRCIKGFCQDHDTKGTSFELPGTQRHAEFEVALRRCSRDANDDYSRVHTATRSDCKIPVHLHPSSRTSRQTRMSCRPNVPHIQILVVHFLTVDFVSGTFHRYSFQ